MIPDLHRRVLATLPGSNFPAEVPHMINVNDLIKRRAAPVLFRPHRSFFRGLLAAAPAGISPRMAHLIAEYRRCAETLAAIEYATDAVAWDAVGDLESRALEALLDQRPANMAEYHTKFEALIPATENDTEFYVLRVLAADARELAEAAR
jgi:hypothetical protein